jgi:hypothetical protein
MNSIGKAREGFASALLSAAQVQLVVSPSLSLRHAISMDDDGDRKDRVPWRWIISVIG